MELHFKEHRDRDFFNVCEKIRKESGAYLSISGIARLAVYREAQSFYLSEKEYVKIFHKARIYPRLASCKFEIKNEMYREIRSRFLEIKYENPRLNHFKIAKIMSEQTAPRLYITERSAVELYYKLLKELK
jgi:hypothetical protein